MGKIYLYTSLFPFGRVAETFINNELKYVGDSEVVIIPVNKDVYKRGLPSNVKLDTNICDRDLMQIFQALCGIFTPQILSEIYKSRKTIVKTSYLRNLLKYLYAANLVYFDIKKRIKMSREAIFYSYWLSYAPIAFALYKSKNKTTSCKFISRAHGSDLYSTDVGVYYPLRDFSFHYIDEVYVISSFGIKYLREKYKELDSKLNLSHLGVEDNTFPRTCDDDEKCCFNIVSCSSVIPIKRVELIFTSIYTFAKTHPNIKLKWSHFGDGYLMAELRRVIADNVKLDNFAVELMGSMDNEKILKRYRENRYHCLVNLSESEGVPVSMMEAISSSIPLLGTNVGGTSDIITNETGKLISSNFEQIEFDNALSFILDNYRSLSISAYHFYLKYYNSRVNYTEFYNSLRFQTNSNKHKI